MALTRKPAELKSLQILRARPRGRLVRHYFFISLILISGGLIASGLLEIYFRYQESREQIALLHREAAAAAAFKIERFVQEIESMMKAATRSRDIVLKGLTPEYKFELEKLLLVARAITEVVAYDMHGIAQVEASRLRATAYRSKRELAPANVSQTVIQGASYFGPVYFVRDSEPYMTVAVPIDRFAGEPVGALRAEVNLKYIWDVISSIKVGKAGYAYLVNRPGDLIAHPDISLVLQRRSLAHLDQVKGAFQPAAALPKPKGFIADDLRGERVFGSSTVIPKLDWAVIIERPAKEAYESLYASLVRTSTLLLVGLGMALLASIFVARRVVSPLQKLRQGVGRIGAGDLSYRVELKTGDELEALAKEFNKMTASLQEAQSGLEHKVAERTEELVIANQRLDEASRHKSQFLANVSHELRTPLNAIIGFTRLVLRKTEGQIPVLQSENLRKVLLSSEHLLKLINGLLDLSKIEAGRMDLFVESFRIGDVVQMAASTVEPMLRNGRVRLVMDISPDIPPLKTDQEKFHQILLNLLSNAAKFTAEGDIKISAWQENGSLRLAVSDTGTGIEKEALNTIFEEFRQGDMTGARGHGGTGLGLAIAKRFANLLGGHIVVESEMGKGSTFTVTLPLNRPAVN
jgi:signal transduction histidine kinase